MTGRYGTQDAAHRRAEALRRRVTTAAAFLVLAVIVYAVAFVMGAPA